MVPPAVMSRVKSLFSTRQLAHVVTPPLVCAVHLPWNRSCAAVL